MDTRRLTRERAGFLAVLLGSALTLACGPTFPDPAAVRAVILVDVDTLRADHLSAYGYARQTSPNIDAFARRAVQFDWAFSQAPNTLPSQTSILTSLYPSTHLVLHDGDRLAPAVVTLAERFQEAGFATGAFIDGGYMKSQFGLDQGFDTYFDINGGGLAVGESHIGKWLAEQSQGRFFLLIHTYDVHTPYAPREPFRSRFLADLAAPTPGFEPTSEALESIRMSQYTAEPRSLAGRDLEYARALYDGEVALVDDWFGRFLRQLDDLGLTDSTVVALVSDHGEEFQEHGSVLHEKLYRTVTHVPLVVRAPGARNGRRVGETVETIDLAPTLLELAGVAAPAADEGMQGDPRDGRTVAGTLARRRATGAGADGVLGVALLRRPAGGDERPVSSDPDARIRQDRALSLARGSGGSAGPRRRSHRISRARCCTASACGARGVRRSGCSSARRRYCRKRSRNRCARWDTCSEPGALPASGAGGSAGGNRLAGAPPRLRARLRSRKVRARLVALDRGLARR